MKFIHCSDLHLGASRFGNGRLRGDLARAFTHMAADAVKQDVDAVIICGDVFDRFGTDLLALHEAEGTFAQLKDRGIETIAIEGDHDVFGGHEVSWLRFLARKGLVRLLDARPGAGAELQGWNDERGTGPFIDVEGVRFFGLGCRGEAGPMSMRLVREAIEPAELTVAMMHAMVGQRDGSDPCAMSVRDAEVLREKADYLALGHVHGRYSIDDWIFNPGGLENWRPEECAARKGYFLVDVSGPRFRAEAVDSVRRVGHIVSVDVSGLGMDAAVNKAIKAAIRGADIDPAAEPVVSVDLIGRPRFDLSRYDGGSLCSWIISLTGAVECLINDRTRLGPAGAVHSAIAREAGRVSRMDDMLRSSEASTMTPEERADLILRLPAAVRDMGGNR